MKKTIEPDRLPDGAGELAPEAIEEQAREIAERHLLEIQKRDPEPFLRDPKEIEGVLEWVRAIEREKSQIAGGTAFATMDKLGNLPGKTYSTLMFDGLTDEIFAYLKRIAADPAEHAADFASSRDVAQSGLPQLLQKPFLNILMTEGEHPIQEAYQELLQGFEDNPPKSGQEAVGRLVALRDDDRFSRLSHDRDRIRARAVEMILERLFPWLGDDAQLACLKKQWRDVRASVTPDVATKCARHLFIRQNISFFEQCARRLEGAKEALGKDWTDEEKPRHRIGKIFTTVMLPLAVNEILSEDTYEQLYADYTDIAKSLPFADDPKLIPRLQEITGTILAFIDRAIEAFTSADTMK